MKLEYFGIKKNNVPFRVVNSGFLKKDLDNLPSGRYSVIIEKAKKHKSNSQLGYYYAGVLPIVLKALNDAGWEFTSIDEVDEYCKSMFAEKDMINRHTGEIKTIPALKRTMTTTEMMTYIDAIRNWCAEYLNTYIPEPEQNLKINYHDES